MPSRARGGWSADRSRMRGCKMRCSVDRLTPLLYFRFAAQKEGGPTWRIPACTPYRCFNIQGYYY